MSSRAPARNSTNWSISYCLVDKRSATEKGTRGRLFHPPAEGKLIRGFEGLDVGDRVRVELIGVHVEQGFIDFARTG